MTVYDLPTGYGGFILWLLGGPRLVPAVGYMGGKRRLAPVIGEALGVAPGLKLDRVVLVDAGCPGWVWPEILDVQRAARVAEVLWSWRHEGPVELWERLVKRPPAADPSERAAQVLWLQGRAANNSPIRWDGALWRMDATGRAQQFRAHRPRTPQARQGRPQSVGHSRGLTTVLTVAQRVEAIARALSRHRVTFHHGDIFDVLDDARTGDLVYLDPDYQGCTSYGATVPRARLLDTAEDLRARGVTVGISEAAPLPLPGWWHADLTLPGGKPEWLTLSREPQTRQARLWGAA